MTQIINSPSISHGLSIYENSDIDKKISKMSIEEKIGQLFITFIYGTELTNSRKKLIDETKLGNFILFQWANDFSTSDQLKNFTKELKTYVQSKTGFIPLIAIDHEGGVISRYKCLKRFPGNMALGATQDFELAKKVAKTMGKELRENGINLNFAPVVDVQNNPNNPIIGVRSYGDDPENVARFAKNMIEGFHEEGIGTTIKHWPGHGDVNIDSHYGTGIVDKSSEEIEKIHLRPFYLLKDSTDAIMSAHLIFPALDPENPATFSPIILQDLLREKWKFKGVVISDSLVMRGAVKDQTTFEKATQGVVDAAIRAFLAGCDLMILGKLEFADFEATQKNDEEMIRKTIAGFRNAVKQEKISEERINASLKRILVLKQKLSDPAMLSSQKKGISPQVVAKKALTLASPKELYKKVNTKIKDRNVCIIAPSILKENIEEAISLFDSKCKPILCLFDLKENPNTNFDKSYEIIASSDIGLFLSYNAHLNPHQSSFLEKLCQKFSKDRLIIAAMRNPFDAFQNGLSNHHLTFLTYSPMPCSISTLLECLDNHEMPQGKLPITLSSLSKR